MPDVEKIVIRAVSYSLTVLKDMLYKGFIKEGFNEIAAFFPVVVDLKKRGYFFSVVFQRGTVAEQFIFLVRRVIIRYLAPYVEVVTA